MLPNKLISHLPLKRYLKLNEWGVEVSVGREREKEREICLNSEKGEININWKGVNGRPEVLSGNY